jgi:hypothetical protein
MSTISLETCRDIKREKINKCIKLETRSKILLKCTVNNIKKNVSNIYFFGSLTFCHHGFVSSLPSSHKNTRLLRYSCEIRDLIFNVFTQNVQHKATRMQTVWNSFILPPALVLFSINLYHWRFTAKARLKYQAIPCAPWGAQSDNGTLFLTVHRSSRQYHSTTVPYSFIHLLPRLYNLRTWKCR